MHGAEYRGLSVAARESFTHDAGDSEDRWAWGGTENGGSCEATVPGRPPASPCPAAAAPWRAGCSRRLQNLTAPGLELRSGRAQRDLTRPREAEVTVAGPGGGPSPRRQPALGVGDIGRASGWWRQRGLRTGGSGGQRRPGASEGGPPRSTYFWRLPGRPGLPAGAVGKTQPGRGARPACGSLPGSGARPAQSPCLTSVFKAKPPR